jgi:uncharacterized protein YbjT (DUF2867 family)
MQSGPLVAVLGATGHQGCGVVHSLLGEGNFRVRACSLEITGAKFGDKVEAVKMDMTKKEDILKAFQGVDYVFAMTDSADPRSKNKEYQIGKQLVDCAKEQGIKFFVWSSACDAHNISNQKYKLPMLTDKHQVSQYLAQSGLGHASILPSLFYDNWKEDWRPQHDGDTLVFSFPIPKDTHLQMVDPIDVGKTTCAILRSPDSYNGQQIALVAETKPISDYLQDIESQLNVKTKFQQVKKEEWGQTRTEETLELFCFAEEYGVIRGEFNQPQHQLRKFPEWLKETNVSFQK